MNNNNSACVRKPRRVAGSYKPTADKLNKAVCKLDNRVDTLEQEVDTNTTNISNNTTTIQESRPSVISFALASNVTIPSTTTTLVTNWNILEATNDFSSSNFTNGTFTVPMDGIYYVSSNIAWNATGNSGLVRTIVTKNSGGVEIYPAVNNIITGQFTTQHPSPAISASTNDTIYIEVNQTSAGDMQLSEDANTTWNIVKY